MNFEQLSKLILANFEKISQDPHLRKRTKIYIKNYFFLLNLKLKKLKLGLVSFELKQFFFGNIFLYDVLEMRYSRQDTTEQDELKLENRLNAIKWKWDFQNVGALLLILIFVWFIVKSYFDIMIKELFYSFYQIEQFDIVKQRFLKSTLIFKKFNFSDQKLFSFEKINEFFVETLLKFFIHFKFF